MKRILIVDDEKGVRILMETILASNGYVVLEADGSDSAISILNGDPNVDLVISDIRMPSTLDGVELMQYIVKTWAKPVILISGFSEYTEEDVMSKGGSGFFPKPFSRQRFLAKVQELIGK